MTPKKRTPNSTQIETLWNDHHLVIERTLCAWSGRLRNDQDIQDAIAATYEKTLGFLLRGGTINDNPRGWLTILARREFIRTITHTYNRSAELRDDYAQPKAATDLTPGPDEIAMDQVTASLDGELDRALGRLTPRQRTVLTEIHLGYTYDEIQQRNGWSYTAVNKAATRGRTKLRNDDALQRAYREWSD